MKLAISLADYVSSGTMAAMAKRFTYKGEPCRLGRFGFIKSGDVLHLSDEEAESVKGDSAFNQIYAAEVIDSIPIKDSEHYVLSSLPWGTKFLRRRVTRLGRMQLVKVAKAMNESGVKVQVSLDQDRKAMAETVIEAGRAAGWI